MKIIQQAICIIAISSLSMGLYAEQISAKTIFEGSLDQDLIQSSYPKYNAIEASLLIYDAQERGSLHHLNTPLLSRQKFKIRLKSTVDGQLQVLAKNADGTQQPLPSLTVQRGQEIDYPEHRAVLMLDGAGKQDELVLTLTPRVLIEQPQLAKTIFEGSLEEEDTQDASYVAMPVGTQITKRIILTHRAQP